MKSAVGARKVLLALALLGIAAGMAKADPSPENPVVDHLNYYFEHPNSPGAFRALTGQGVAPFATEETGVSAVLEDWSDQGPLMTRLFPGFVDDGSFDSFRCRPDYALQTLRARIAQLGANHPYVSRWVEVQRAVFAACAADETVAAVELPPALPIDNPVLARLQADDRAYQTASVAFYRGDRQSALAAFREIAHSDSPHRASGVYMVAAIRAGSDGSLLFGHGEKPLVDEAQSIAEVEAILSDPGLVSVHPIAQELLGWIGANRADDATRRAQVRATLAALEAPGDRLAADPRVQRQYGLARQDIDGLHLAGDQDGVDLAWWLKGGPPAGFTASQAMMDAARTDPMAAWLLFPPSCVQGQPWAPFAQNGAQGWPALEAFAQAKAGQVGAAAQPWKRLSLSVSRHYDPALWSQVQDEQARAAAGDEQAVAALAFDFYHQVRTALSAPDAGSETTAFAVALAHMRAFPFKTSAPYLAAGHDGLQYLMTVGRVDDARQWRDILAAAGADLAQGCCVNNALLAILAEDPAHLATALTASSGAALPLQNNLSIAAMRGLAERPDMPSLVRARFARIAWGRTYALGETVDADLDQLTRTLNPEMTKAWIHRGGKPVKPGDHQALLDVLRSPAVNILIVDEDRNIDPLHPSDDGPGATRIDLFNHDDDNWWCRWKSGRNSRDVEGLLDDAFFASADMKLVDGRTAFGLRAQLRPVLAASYLVRNQAPAEAAALSQVTCAPKLLTERVLDWVKEPPWIFWGRDGQAEALALAIKTTHYGCYSDGPHGAYSKAAWVLLHNRFPQTQWAIKTKYWYNCFYGAPCPAEGDDGPAR